MGTSVEDGGVDWSEVYRLLFANREDRLGNGTLERRVAGWARRDLPGCGWADQQEVVADTCADVLVNFQKARGAATFAGFVWGYYRNALRAALRRLKRSDVPLDTVPEPGMSDPEPFDQRQTDALQRCIDGLGERERMAVTMRYVDDRSPQEIGVVMGVSGGNARQIVFRALARLRDCLTAELQATGS